MTQTPLLTILALTSTLGLLLITFLRIAFLRSRGKLTSRSFSVTLAAGLSLAALDLYYVNLGSYLIAESDPFLSSLGLLIALVIFALGSPLARLGYGLFESRLRSDEDRE